MNILGISALYHDSAAAVISNGEIIAAAQEERFTRKKADASIPVNAIAFCMNAVGGKIDQVVYYDNPYLTMDRWLTDAIAAAPDNEKIIEKSFDKIFAERLWIQDRLKALMGDRWPRDKKLLVCEHHISHAASAYYPSPFQESAILTMDGVGEWATTTIGRGKGKHIEILEQINYPDSIGLLYSAFTYFCGFKVNFGEYKLMGLAPYGEPIYEKIILENLVTIEENGHFKLNQEYFTYRNDDQLIDDRFGRLFGMKKREPESPITKPYMDLAASIQVVTEEIVLRLAKHAQDITKSSNLVLAGGIALNCVANGKILRSKVFDKMWIQPAAGDAGGALGCALYAAYNIFDCERKVGDDDTQKGSYLGPAFTNKQIRDFLEKNDIVFHYYEEDELYGKIAGYLTDDKVIGLHHGAMEYGPRALGNRSIIANPMSGQMQSKLNLKIKFRESFRPFAPAVLDEDTKKYFNLDCKSPYMLITAPVNEKIRVINQDKGAEKGDNIYDTINIKRSMIPAITHVDYSARIQTVHKATNPYFYKVIEAFKKLTKCGVVVNTSFNVRGEPIVCTPKDSWLCFMRTDMDVLVLENYVILKEEQKEWSDETDWREIYELD